LLLDIPDGPSQSRCEINS